MKTTISVMLSAASITTSAVLAPVFPLGLLSNPTFMSQSSVSTATPFLLGKPSSNISLVSTIFPDRRFKVNFFVTAPLLPINSALINILQFMSIVAAQDWTQETQPRVYSTRKYRDVEISTHAWTEAHFLLWGMYISAIEMVKFARFNEATLELYWETTMVGKVRIAVKRASSLAGGGGNSTQDLGDTLAQTNLTGSGEAVPDSKSIVDTGIDSNLAPLNSFFINASTEISAPIHFAINFVPISGGGALNRNEVFLTFYTAILHVAQFPAESYMQSFTVASPSRKLFLHIQNMGADTPYRKVLAALLYVPTYMLEHPNFGYRETDFIVSLRGPPAYLGTLLKAPLPPPPDESRSSEVEQTR